MAAALMMLAMVSALVAFRGWPGGAEDAVSPVPISPRSDTPVELTQVRRVAVPRAGEVKRVAAAAGEADGARASASTRGLVKHVIIASPAPPTIVKVPRGIEMDPSPTRQPPTVPPGPTTPLDDQPAAPSDDPSQLIPETLPPGTAPGDVVTDVIGTVPDGDGTAPGDGSDAPVGVVVNPEPPLIGVTIGDTSFGAALR